MRLISMTDFVLEQSKEIKSEMIGYGEFIDKVVKYANFLKQPLKLEMFVPCDEDGSILSEPKCNHSFDIHGEVVLHHEGCNIKDWNKSKEKVLFDGFNDIEAINYHISRNRNIEYLSKFGTIQLTPNATKQFL